MTICAVFFFKSSHSTSLWPFKKQSHVIIWQATDLFPVKLGMGWHLLALEKTQGLMKRSMCDKIYISDKCDYVARPEQTMNFALWPKQAVGCLTQSTWVTSSLFWESYLFFNKQSRSVRPAFARRTAATPANQPSVAVGGWEQHHLCVSTSRATLFKSL